MISVDRAKDWVTREHAHVYRVFENKYLGMLYDRFASLPPYPPKAGHCGIYGDSRSHCGTASTLFVFESLVL